MNTGYFESLSSAGILSGWFVTSDAESTADGNGEIFMVRQGSNVIGVGRRTTDRPDVEELFGVRKAGFSLRVFPLRKLDPEERLNILVPGAATPISTNTFLPTGDFLSGDLGGSKAAARNLKIFQSILDSEMVATQYAEARGLKDQSRQVALLYYLSMVEEWAERPSPFIDPELVAAQMQRRGISESSPLEALFNVDDAMLAPSPAFDPMYVSSLMQTPTGATAPTAGQLLARWVRLAVDGQIYRPCALVRGKFGPDGLFNGSQKEATQLLKLLQELADGTASFDALAEVAPVFDAAWLRMQPLKASDNGSTVLRRLLTQQGASAPNAYFAKDAAALENFQSACNRSDIGEPVGMDSLNDSLNARVLPFAASVGQFNPDQPLAQLQERARWNPAAVDESYLEQILPGVTKFAAKKFPKLDLGLFHALHLQPLEIPGSLRETDLRVPHPKLNPPRLRGLGQVDESAAVKASVIVPTYGRLDLLFGVLSSLALSSSSINAEVIVSDDGSGADLSILSFLFPSVRILTATKNRGFLLNVNNAATKAKGEYIVLVNNDVIVHRRALDELIETFDRSSRVGIVGGMVLASDGLVQECGGAIWNDATAWNLFRGQSENEGLPRNIREADYVSGCWLAIRKSVWDTVGGFSPEFAPAYCEDMDLCLKVRKLGMRVVVNPHSRITHLEGASMGTDTGSRKDGKRFQVINQQRAFEKWRTTLQLTYEPNGNLSRQFRGNKRLLPVALIFDHYCPEPDRDAGSKTVFELVTSIVDVGHYYPIFVPQNGNYTKYAAALERMGVEVIWAKGWERFDKMLANHGQDVKLVLCSRLGVARHFNWHIKQLSGKKIIYIHDVEEVRHATALGAVSGSSLEEIYRRHVENWKDEYGLFDHVLTCSEEESGQLARLLTIPITAMSPYSVPATPSPAPANGCDMLFVGSFNHHPNLAAVEWFVSEVLPRVRAAIPTARLHVAGSGFDAADWLNGEGVVLHGPVSETTLKFLYSLSTFAVAPLLDGAGMKGKVVEAFAHGRGCVGTAIAYQGLGDALKEFPAKYAELMSGTPETLAQRIVKYASGTPLDPKLLLRALQLTLGHRNPQTALRELLEQEIGATSA